MINIFNCLIGSVPVLYIISYRSLMYGQDFTFDQLINMNINVRWLSDHRLLTGNFRQGFYPSYQPHKAQKIKGTFS